MVILNPTLKNNQKMIKEIKDLKASEWDEKSKRDLEEIYKQGLVDDIECLYTLYVKDRGITDEQYLQNNIDNYEEAIGVCTNIITLFHNKFTNEKNRKQAVILRGYIENLQIHLVRLQSQCNQLIYRKQQRNNKFSRRTANIALGGTIILSLLSILFSYFDWKYEDISGDIKCMSDSIQILNEKIEHQNKVIKEYSMSKDSIADIDRKEYLCGVRKDPE